MKKCSYFCLELFAMLRNYIISALRNLNRDLAYSVITIFGFAVGLASFIILFLYIKSETNYDEAWSNGQRIYRISQTLNMAGNDDPFALTAFPVAPSLKDYTPEIEDAVRFTLVGAQSIEVEGQVFNVEDVYAADSTFYKIFDYKFIVGNPVTALTEPQTAIISEQEALRFFGTTDVIGRVFKTRRNTVRISGVFKNNDFVSHFVPQILVSTASLNGEYLAHLNEDWFRMASYTYLLTYPGTSTEALKRSVDRWVVETLDPWINDLELSAKASFTIEALRDIHFNTMRQYDMPSNTSSAYVYIFGAIGIFILLIASINYMNLATAKSIRRAREIGIRKVAGAGRGQLLVQFLSESLLFSLLAMVIALVLIELFTPVFNNLTGKNLSLFHETPGMNLAWTWAQVLAIVFFTGLLSGSFPALVLSAFKPIHVLKGSAMKVSGKNMVFSTKGIRKALVIFQFTISITMLISTWVVYTQLQYMRNSDPGFDKDNVLLINMPSDSVLAIKKQGLINDLNNYSGIEKATAANNLPGYEHGRLLFFIDEDGQWINKTMNFFSVGDEYQEILKLELKAGRFFSRDFANDDTAAFVVNEAAVKYLGLENPIGHRMRCGLDVNGEIVGVVSDFFYASLQKPVEPLVFICKPDWLSHILVKIKSGKLDPTMTYIEHKWREFDQRHPFTYSFLDNNFDQQYDRERQLLQIFGYFAILIIIISSMGLLGLSSFTAEQRRKEIGIRKILGGTQNQIVTCLVKEFLFLILIAGAIAIPLSYWLMRRWLEEFAHRIELNWWFFAVSLLAALAIALLTVIFQASKSARAKPVEVLKCD